MEVREREPGDVERLEELIRAERQGKQRDRFRMALLAIRGEEKLRIAEVLGVAKSTVETWVYRYRDDGLGGLRARKQPGAPRRLSCEASEAFKARMLGGPRPEDGVCTLRGRDALRILEHEFGVRYSLSSAYGLLHALGLSCLTPRPRHEKNDQAAMAQFKESAPLLSRM